MFLVSEDIARVGPLHAAYKRQQHSGHDNAGHGVRLHPWAADFAVEADLLPYRLLKQYTEAVVINMKNKWLCLVLSSFVDHIYIIILGARPFGLNYLRAHRPKARANKGIK